MEDRRPLGHELLARRNQRRGHRHQRRTHAPHESRPALHELHSGRLHPSTHSPKSKPPEALSPSPKPKSDRVWAKPEDSPRPSETPKETSSAATSPQRNPHSGQVDGCP